MDRARAGNHPALSLQRVSKGAKDAAAGGWQPTTEDRRSVGPIAPGIRCDHARQKGGQGWTTWRVRDTNKGPVVWHAKHALIYIADEQRLPHGP